MKQEAKQNIKPLLVIGVGVLALTISGYQIATGAHGSPFVVENQVQKQNSATAQSAAAAQKDLSENVDSDGDGLTDNQESQICHTNPFSADTDHDGHSDMEEIKSGYDPLVADPNSTASFGYTNPYRYDTTLGGSSTSVDNLQSASQQGKNLTDSSKDSSGIGQLANLMAANQAISTEGDLPEVKDSEIIVSPISGKPAVERYITSFAVSAANLAPFTSQDDAKEYVKAAVTGDTARINQLTGNAKQYEKALLELPVPTELIGVHKRAIGSVRLFLQSTQLFSDPGSLSSDQGFKAINQVEGLMNISDNIVQDLLKSAQKYNINLNVPL